jgi:tetratricopeptide (TPR) repeat protein
VPNTSFTGYALSGADPTAAFLAGQVAATDGDEQASVNYLRRAAKLDPSLLPEITKLYVQQLKRPNLALEAAGNDVPTLKSLADLLSESPDSASQALAERARQKAFEALLEQSNDPAAPGAVLAAVAAEYIQRGNPEQAVVFYRRALTREISQTEWRMELARALQKLGRNQEAQHEVQTVLRWRPRLPEAVKLLDELNTKKPEAHD